MHALPNSCNRSNFVVTPRNWKSQKASIKKTWKILYRFYDPAFKGTALWGKLIPVKGMNSYQVLEQRQAITAGLISVIEERLEQGFNPITGIYPELPKEQDQAQGVVVISPATPFITALTEAEKKLDVVPAVHDDMRSIIRGVNTAAGKLYDKQLHKKYTELFISQIQSRHITYLFEQCALDNPKFSAKRQNRYKAYLSMMFNLLKTLQAIKENPTELVVDRKVIVKQTVVLTNEEAEKIDKHLFKKDYFFWRYVQIFFHSGARSTEMLYIQKDAKVNLEKGEFIVVQKKGGEYKEVIRIISKEVLHLWQEILDETKEGEYLFSTGFQPGSHRLYQDRATKKWLNLVKAPVKDGGLGINKDFYPLKHLHSDLVAAKLSLKHAKEAMGHTSEKTARIYAIGEDERRREEVRNLDVKFVG